MSPKDKEYIKKHLGYELQMLLGAAAATKVFDEYKLGNVCSATRDSIYLHTRNLYNFFCTKSRNDRHINEFGHTRMTSPLSTDEEDALHSHALHIKKEREYSINPVDLSKIALRFEDDMVNLWEQWGKASQGDVKTLLSDTLLEAKESAINTEADARKRSYITAIVASTILNS